MMWRTRHVVSSSYSGAILFLLSKGSDKATHLCVYLLKTDYRLNCMICFELCFCKLFDYNMGTLGLSPVL